MRNPSLHFILWGYMCNLKLKDVGSVTHVIVVACPHLLRCCIYCLCFYTFWYCYSYILQHFNQNVLHLIFCCVLACGCNAVYTLEPHPFFCLTEVSNVQKQETRNTDRHRNPPKNEVRQLSRYEQLEAVTQPETAVMNTVL